MGTLTAIPSFAPSEMLGDACWEAVGVEEGVCVVEDELLVGDEFDVGALLIVADVVADSALDVVALGVVDDDGSSPFLASMLKY
jgi:hypothetical protein